jgi:uncharacterized protein with GYD domain
MTTFFMFGKYTPESVRQVSIERTQQAVAAIKGLGGEVTAMHVLLGEYDLLFCVSLPGIEQAVQASVTLSRLTGIGFTTCPAMAVETFDRLVTGKGL